MRITRFLGCCALVAWVGVTMGAPKPQQATPQADSPVVLSDGPTFSQHDGAGLYRAVCQGCHMAAGQGAVGAGAYPALASDARLAAAAYPVTNILQGRKGMPAFGDMLSDDQIAQVTNYVRTHLGNHYTDAVAPEDVKSLRRAP